MMVNNIIISYIMMVNNIIISFIYLIHNENYLEREIIALCIKSLWQFEIRNFKTQKWVSMLLSYLVEFFFWSFWDLRFFIYKNFSKKIDFLVIFWDFTGSPQTGSGQAVWRPRKLFFGQWKLSVFCFRAGDQYLTSNNPSKFKVNFIV